MRYRKYKTLTPEQFQTASNEEIIESYIPVVLNIAKRFPRRYIDRDDAIGIGLMTLVTCVKEGTRYSQAEMTNFINCSVYNRIKEHCLNYYGKSVVKTKRGTGDTIKTQPLNESREPTYKENGFNIVDFKDSVTKVVRTVLEETIVERLILEGGYTLIDIAEECEVSSQYVSRKQIEILEKLQCELQK